jgi:hypothetical protein
LGRSLCGDVPKQSGFQKGKAVTIGIGFRCEDGIVLCADTQITYPAYHKYYDHKIYHHSENNEYTTAFTFSGNPNLMRMFFDKFCEAVAVAQRPLTESKIRDVIETVLGCMDVLDNDELHLLCGIVVPPSGMKFLKTERKIVSEVPSRFDFVGVGDSSLLRYLAPLLTQRPSYKAEQACYLGIYLTLQAKRYVDGCGGETDAIVLKKNGSVSLLTSPYSIEQALLKMEFLLGRIATFFFDNDVPESEFNDHLRRFTESLQSQRPDFHRNRF